MRGESRLGREAPHRLVGEEQKQERSPVGDERPAASEGDGDNEQRENHPFGFDRDAAPQHHSEDDREINETSDQEDARTPASWLCLSRCGQPPPPRSQPSRKKATRWSRPPRECVSRPRRARRPTNPRRRSSLSAGRRSRPRKAPNRPAASPLQRGQARPPTRSA